MSRRLIFIAAAVTVLALSLAGSAGASTPYTDPTGDSGGAPDITNIVADNDASGNISIAIQVANQASLAADAILDIGINADRAATGGSDGADFHLVLFGDDHTYGWYQWNGSTFAATAGPPSLRVSAGTNSFLIVINKADLQNTAAFDFYVIGAQLSGGNVVAEDDAPDGTAVYTYTLTAGTTTTTTTPTTTSTPPPPPPPPPPPATKIVIGGAAAKAPGLHAGKTFVIAAHVATNAATATVKCTGKVGTKAVAERGSYAAGTAMCRGTAPAGTAGKRLTLTISVSGGGKTVTRTFSLLIGK